MEEVGIFLHDRRNLSLEVMLNAFSYVVVCEQSKGFVTATDLKTGILLCFGRQGCTSTELMVYSTLILESCLHAQLCPGGDLCLTVRKHINDPARFIESLVTILSVDKRNLPAVESLKNQRKDHIICKMGSNSGQMTGNNTAQCPEPSGDQICGPEIPEPIVRFLARVRRSGMDILFPQNTHDKVLVCILMAIKAFKVPPAHRDLIELVMVVKESGKISELESVSKTKVRGVLALLKHGEMLASLMREGLLETLPPQASSLPAALGARDTVKGKMKEDGGSESRALSTTSTNTNQNDVPLDIKPVRLRLEGDVSNIDALRRKHDRHIVEFAMESEMDLRQNDLWKFIIWKFDKSVRKERLRILKNLGAEVEEFFLLHLSRTTPSSSDVPSKGSVSRSGRIGVNNEEHMLSARFSFDSLDSASTISSLSTVSTTPSTSRDDWDRVSESRPRASSCSFTASIVATKMSLLSHGQQPGGDCHSQDSKLRMSWDTHTVSPSACTSRETPSAASSRTLASERQQEMLQLPDRMVSTQPLRRATFPVPRHVQALADRRTLENGIANHSDHTSMQLIQNFSRPFAEQAHSQGIFKASHRTQGTQGCQTKTTPDPDFWEPRVNIRTPFSSLKTNGPGVITNQGHSPLQHTSSPSMSSAMNSRRGGVKSVEMQYQSKHEQGEKFQTHMVGRTTMDNRLGWDGTLACPPTRNLPLNRTCSGFAASQCLGEGRECSPLTQVGLVDPRLSAFAVPDSRGRIGVENRQSVLHKNLPLTLGHDGRGPSIGPQDNIIGDIGLHELVVQDGNVQNRMFRSDRLPPVPHHMTQAQLQSCVGNEIEAEGQQFFQEADLIRTRKVAHTHRFSPFQSSHEHNTFLHERQKQQQQFDFQQLQQEQEQQHSHYLHQQQYQRKQQQQLEEQQHHRQQQQQQHLIQHEMLEHNRECDRQQQQQQQQMMIIQHEVHQQLQQQEQEQCNRENHQQQQQQQQQQLLRCYFNKQSSPHSKRSGISQLNSTFDPIVVEGDRNQRFQSSPLFDGFANAGNPLNPSNTSCTFTIPTIGQIQDHINSSAVLSPFANCPTQTGHHSAHHGADDRHSQGQSQSLNVKAATFVPHKRNFADDPISRGGVNDCHHSNRQMIAPATSVHQTSNQHLAFDVCLSNTLPECRRHNGVDDILQPAGHVIRRAPQLHGIAHLMAPQFPFPPGLNVTNIDLGWVGNQNITEETGCREPHHREAPSLLLPLSDPQKGAATTTTYPHLDTLTAYSDDIATRSFFLISPTRDGGRMAWEVQEEEEIVNCLWATARVSASKKDDGRRASIGATDDHFQLVDETLFDVDDSPETHVPSTILTMLNRTLLD